MTPSRRALIGGLSATGLGAAGLVVHPGSVTGGDRAAAGKVIAMPKTANA